MTTPIASSIAICLKSFEEIMRLIRSLSERAQDFQIDAWEDELGRLRIWTANIGAHKLNQASLDFRLRDASHIRDQIWSLLERLLAGLKDARNIVAEATQSEHEISMGETSNDEGPLSDMKELQITIASVIKSLFTMSILVRQPAQHDSRLAILSRPEVVAFEPYDYAHVRDKYPKADEVIVSRLASAITRRRMYLRHQAMQAAKLRQLNANLLADKNAAETVVSDTFTTNAEAEFLEFSDETEYSKEILPYLMTDPCTPPPREFYSGSPFECPSCCYVIRIYRPSTWVNWNRHVLEDLRPLVCLNIDCTTPHKTYVKRHEWLQHLETCRSRLEQESKACPLCAMVYDDGSRPDAHLARHLLDLFLFALRHDIFDLEDDSQTDKSAAATRTAPILLGSPAIPSIAAGGEVDEAAARAGIEDSGAKDLSIEHGASDDKMVGWKRSNRLPSQEEISKEKQGTNRESGLMPALSDWWWYCCQDGNLINPSISFGRCTTCGHSKCDICRSARLAFD